MTRWLAGAAVVCVVAVAAPARADDKGDGWTGQAVWPRKPNLDLRDKDGKAVARFSLGAEVLAAEKGRVRVRHSEYPGPYEGYVGKDEVVRAADAAAHFTARLKADPEDRWALICRAQVRTHKGEPAAAIKDLSEAIRIEPEVQAYILRGVLRSQTGDPDQAVKDFTEAIRLDPESPSAFAYRGQERWQRKDYGGALKDFDEVIRIDPQFPGAFLGRGVARHDLGEYAAAARDYEAAIKLEPKQPGGYNNLAWLLATCPDGKFRDGKRAVELAAKACELSEWKIGSAVGTLAAAHAEAGNFDKAVKHLKQALADPEYEKEHGEEARGQLKLYEAGKPYREEPPAKK